MVLKLFVPLSVKGGDGDLFPQLKRSYADLWEDASGVKRNEYLAVSLMVPSRPQNPLSPPPCFEKKLKIRVIFFFCLFIALG